MSAPAPITWEQVQENVADGSIEALSKLRRSQAVYETYVAFKQMTLREYKDMSEYMKISVYSPKVGVDEDGKKFVAGPLQPGPEPKVVFRANDFPYWLSEGIEHHVLWSTWPLQEDELLRHIDANRQGYEYVWYFNPVGLRSVPELWHAHVISRPKQA